MNVSKWLKVQVLLEVDELKDLFSGLNAGLYQVSGVLSQPQAGIEPACFFDAYASYIATLKRGDVPLINRPLFSAALSVSPVFVRQLDEKRYIADPKTPVVQMQPHSFVLSNGKCLSMVHGPESHSWGLQFAYPQIAMDAAGNLEKTLRTTENGALFLQIQQWMRKMTKPACFTMDGKKMHFPIRLGKQWSGRLPCD
ncbi:MAG: hypothetical protein KDK44_05245 [Chlamydiia bacterium]|nr:hypothetical protein [Chlamydiia bacterium]HPE85672.1 hypothetical protein [Chlamydiales bacterium]